MKLRDYFEEGVLIESFEIRDDYKKLSKSEMDDIWAYILDIEDKNYLNSFYNLYKNMVGYTSINQGRIYFIYTFIKNNIFEIHFLDITNKESLRDEGSATLKKTTNAIGAFNTVVSIVLKEYFKDNKIVVKIVSLDGRQQLYKKIIEKILRQYNINKNLKITKSSSDAKYNFLIENFINRFDILITDI